MYDFFRFPHTPHLAWLASGEPRDDKVLSARDVTSFLSRQVVLEEKVDGANLGFSLSDDGELRAQNRGQYLTTTPDGQFGGQFARLSAWLGVHGEAIREALVAHAERGLLLFGEWCAARHSIEYTRLPDWFLLFDVVERSTGRFWASTRRDELAARIGLATTPRVALGHFTLGQVAARLATAPSRFRDGPVEGLIVRRESADWCEARAKLVRSDFTQAIGEHWRSRRLEWNRLATASGH
jgi:hypothetical protein